MHEVYLRSLTTDPRRIAITRFPFLIGRNPECDYRIDHPLISRRHCSFFVVKDEFRIQDLESRNGTFLNGQRLSSSGVLHGCSCQPVADFHAARLSCCSQRASKLPSWRAARKRRTASAPA